MGKADPPPAELIAPPLLAAAELGAAWSAAAAGLGWALRGAAAGAAPASIGLEPASGGAAASGSAGVGAAAYFLRRCAVRALSPRAHSSARPFCPPELLCKVSKYMPELAPQRPAASAAGRQRCGREQSSSSLEIQGGKRSGRSGGWQSAALSSALDGSCLRSLGSSHPWVSCWVLTGSVWRLSRRRAVLLARRCRAPKSTRKPLPHTRGISRARSFDLEVSPWAPTRLTSCIFHPGPAEAYERL